jgi:hypothetical protein
LENIKEDFEATRDKLVVQLKGKLKDLLAAEARKNQEDSKKRLEELQVNEEVYKKEVERLANGIEFMKKDNLAIEKTREEKVKYDEIVKKLDAQIAALDVEFVAELPPRWKLMEPPVAVKDADVRYGRLGIAGVSTFAFLILGVAFLESRKLPVEPVDEVDPGLELAAEDQELPDDSEDELAPQDVRERIRE